LQLGAIRMSCYSTLKEKGLRLTQPRRLILDYIHNKGDHLTAKEIISYIHEKFPRINKSTIYRTLELLEKNECVFKSESMDRTIYHHAEEGHHHHLVCSRCGRIIECDEDLFKSVENTLQRQYGFHVDFKYLVMSGLCEGCRRKNG